MLIIKDISNLQSYLTAYQNRKYSIGFVPTMGALHKGHGELIKRSKNDNHKTIVSIFVNEKQFNSKEDFNSYPRNKGLDYDFCSDNDVDLLFEPSAEEIYNKDETILKNNNYNNILCDKYRKGHFDGVITVLNKFFSIVKSNKVYFGEKDFQQLKIIEKFIQEKYKSLDLVSVPTKRNEEGIAYSSRNELLNRSSINKSVLLISKLRKLFIFLRKNLNNKILINKFINKNKAFNIEYLELRNKNNLSLIFNRKNLKLFVCFYIKKVRLIDNF